MEGIHSEEAIEMVKTHVLSVVGNAGMSFSQATILMSKLQMAQVSSAMLKSVKR